MVLWWWCPICREWFEVPADRQGHLGLAEKGVVLDTSVGVDDKPTWEPPDARG